MTARDDRLAGGDDGAGLMLARVLQLASPALPIGAYSYSSGLESALDAGLVHDDESAFEWVADAIVLVQGRFEAPVVAAATALVTAAAAAPAVAAAPDAAAPAATAAPDAALSPSSTPNEAGGLSLAQLDDWVRAGRETAELRLESEQMGYSLRQWLDHVPGSGGAADGAAIGRAMGDGAAVGGARLDGSRVDGSRVDGSRVDGSRVDGSRVDALATPPAGANAAVVFGVAAARLRLSPETAAAAWLWGFAENQVMVLIKAMPIGQIGGQRLLWRLGPVVAATASAAARRPEQQWSNAAPGLAIASMRHERQYSRLFRS